MKPFSRRRLTAFALRTPDLHCTMKFRTLKLQKDRECPVCGDNPTVTKLIDYEVFCGITPAVKAADKGTLAAEFETNVESLKQRLDKGDVFLLDVREPREWDIANINGAKLIPLGELPKRLNEVPRDQDVIVQCKTGVRSAKAVNLMREQGYTRVKNLKGGIIDWIDRIDPSLHRY